MMEATKCGQLLNQYRDKIKIYKFTDKHKESDERAEKTVIENLVNPKLLHRIFAGKVNHDDISKVSTKHDFCGIWRIEVVRKVAFEFATKKDIWVAPENQSKVTQMKIGEDIFNVKNDVISIPVIEKGEDESKLSYLFEYPDNIVDKKLNKYLDKYKDSIISANLDKKIAKWNKDCTLDQLIEQLYVRDIFEFLEEHIYIKNYDDKNQNAYTIIDEALELDISLYLIPVISVHCQIKGENKLFHVDAVKRDIRPIVSEVPISGDLIESVGDGVSEGVALFSPHKVLDEPVKKITKKAVIGLTKKLLRK